MHIETTRPELLAACVALVAHPDDERYQKHFGTTVTTPVFGVEVPVVAHHLADPEKGSGIAMICTFGDTTDVTWWRELDLPTRPIIGWDGRILPETPDWITRESGREAYASHRRHDRVLGQEADGRAARARPGGSRVSPARSPTRSSSSRRATDPLEIVTTRQWYIRNGGRDADLRAATAGPRRGAGLAPGRAWRSATQNWVSGPRRRLADQPPAVLRRADPAVVRRRPARQPRLRTR